MCANCLISDNAARMASTASDAMIGGRSTASFAICSLDTVLERVGGKMQMLVRNSMFASGSASSSLISSGDGSSLAVVSLLESVMMKKLFEKKFEMLLFFQR